MMQSKHSALSLCLICSVILLVGCIEEPSKVATKSKLVAGSSRGVQGMSFSIGQSGRSAPASNSSFSFQPPSRPSRGPTWSQFRGRLGRSITSDSALSTRWSRTDNVYWRTELIGRGASSPVVARDKIFVTASSGYGISADEPGDIQDLKHHVICIDRESGKYLWIRDIQGSPLTQELNNEVLRHGFATSTPVVDQDRVYAFFGASGVFAFDHYGELEWQADVGTGSSEYGSAASLILHDNLLIVNASVESESVYAIDIFTGTGAWRIDEIQNSYSTPVLGVNSDGDRELIIMEKDFVRGFEPDTGEQLWFCEGIHDYVVSTPFVKGGVCFCNGGVQNQMMAIKLGGVGDVTDTHKLWEVPQGANLTSPIYLSGQIYLLSDQGVMQCFDARDGSLISRSRMPTKTPAYASPLFSSNLLFVPTEDNGVVVCKATSDFEQVSHNTIEGDDNSLKTSLAASGRRLFLRNDKFIYCLGPTEESISRIKFADFQDQKELIQPRPRYDSTAEGQKRNFCDLLDHRSTVVEAKLLEPFREQLDDKQKASAVDIVKVNFKEIDELRKQHRDAYWEFLYSGSQHDQELKTELQRIESETQKIADQIRNEIKRDVLTEKQQEQLKD